MLCEAINLELKQSRAIVLNRLELRSIATGSNYRCQSRVTQIAWAVQSEVDGVGDAGREQLRQLFYSGAMHQ